MKVTVTTKAFLAVLTDLAATAGVGSLACVHLRTRIGYWRDEPGQTTLLTGVSTSGMVGGHTWCLAQGTLEPTVWTLDDVKAVRAVFASAVKLHGADHTIDIEVTADRQVTIRETPALFDAGTELSFTGGDPAQYPYAAVAKALDDTEQTVVKRLGVVVPDSRLTSWGGAAMRATRSVAATTSSCGGCTRKAATSRRSGRSGAASSSRQRSTSRRICRRPTSTSNTPRTTPPRPSPIGRQR